MDSLDNIQGFDISFSDYSKRIINIKIEDEIIDKLIFPFKKFDITALEYKPFTRFTLAKSLDDSTEEKLGKFINSIISCLLYTSPSPRDMWTSRMPSSA